MIALLEFAYFVFSAYILIDSVYVLSTPVRAPSDPTTPDA
jgi:hypothetical protein